MTWGAGACSGMPEHPRRRVGHTIYYYSERRMKPWFMRRSENRPEFQESRRAVLI
jgi:hypothetical protein